VTPKWDSATIGDTCEILDNRRKPVTKSDRVQGQIPYYGASGILDYVEDYIFDEKLVLLGEDGAKWGAGDRSAFIIEGKAWVNNHAHVLRPNREALLDEWLTYFLIGSDLSDYISGVTVPKLNQGKMKEIEFPLPPLDEQKRIVAKLDLVLNDVLALEGNISNRHKSLQELNQSAVQSVFNSISERTETSLPEISKNLDSFRIPITKDQRIPGDIPYYGASGIVDFVQGSIFRDNLLLVSEDGANLLARSTPIAFSVSGPSWVNNHAHVLKFENLNDQKFVEYYLESIIVDRFVSGAAQPKLNKSALNRIPILWTHDPSERKLVVQKIESIMAKTSENSSVLASSANHVSSLRSGVLSAAFSGDF
jgi:type I restriction enzyme S subunit